MRRAFLVVAFVLGVRLRVRVSPPLILADHVCCSQAASLAEGAAVAASPRALARRRTHELSAPAAALEEIAAAACSSHVDAVVFGARLDVEARDACGPAAREVTGASEHQHPWLATCISLVFLITILMILLNSETLFGM